MTPLAKRLERLIQPHKQSKANKTRHFCHLLARIRVFTAKLASGLLALGLVLVAHAKDVIQLPAPQSNLDVRNQYKSAVITKALELTKEEYGDFEIQRSGSKMNNLRAHDAIQSGESLNVFFAVESDKWQASAIQIPIPVRLGAGNYRLLLIHKDNLATFKNIKNIEQLQSLSMGIQSDWSTKAYLQKYDFNMVSGQSYDGLFDMLEQKRFDYLLRGAHEVHAELDQRPDLAEALTIAPDIALFVPISTYVYVAPSQPELARRIELGLQRMIDDGSLVKIFNTFHGDAIEKSQLCQRTLLFLSPEHEKLLESRPELYVSQCQ